MSESLRKRCPLASSSRAQRFVVVDLAVVGQPDRPVLVGHGLTGRGREVDDRQAPVPEAHVEAGRGTPPRCTPASSGPRAARAAHMPRIRSSGTGRFKRSIWPQMPHMGTISSPGSPG